MYTFSYMTGINRIQQVIKSLFVKITPLKDCIMKLTGNPYLLCSCIVNNVSDTNTDLLDEDVTKEPNTIATQEIPNTFVLTQRTRT